MSPTRLMIAMLTLALAALAGPARAQTFTIVSVTGGAMGNVAAGATGVTVMQLYTTTTKISGSGNYISGTSTVPTVTVRCAGTCNGAQARVTVTRTGGNVGRGQNLTDISVIAVSPATITGANNSGPGTIDVVMGGWTSASDLQFQMSIRLPILGDDSSTATTASSNFTVAVAKNPTVPSGGTGGTVSAAVRRALSVTKQNDLRFGTFIRPTSGTNYVTVSAAGVRNKADSAGTVGQGTIVLVPSTVSAAQFTVVGEPNTTLSIGVPANFTMTGPGVTLTVTPQPSPAAGTQTIPASGTLAFASGGYFSVTSTQASGNYSGTFTVTFTYN